MNWAKKSIALVCLFSCLQPSAASAAISTSDGITGGTSVQLELTFDQRNPSTGGSIGSIDPGLSYLPPQVNLPGNPNATLQEYVDNVSFGSGLNFTAINQLDNPADTTFNHTVFFSYPGASADAQLRRAPRTLSTPFENRIANGFDAFGSAPVVQIDFGLNDAGGIDGVLGAPAYVDAVAFQLEVTGGSAVDIQLFQTSSSGSTLVHEFSEGAGPEGFVGFDRLTDTSSTGLDFNFNRIVITETATGGSPTSFFIDTFQTGGTVSAVAVPEPSSFAFALVAGGGFVARRIRRKKSKA